MKISRSLLLPVLTMLCLYGSAQDNYKILDSLSGKIVLNIRASSDECIKVVTDKNVYSAGEKIWLRTFLTNNVSGKISVKSKNIFVEFLNSKDSILKKLILNAREQQLSGDIKINKGLSTGLYKIRAFTGEMASVNSLNAYEKSIFIVNPTENLQEDRNNKEALPSLSTIKISFYPEGGTIVTGSNSVIGFRITDINNNPVQLSGVIKNNKDTNTLMFGSDHLGLGRFSLFPSRFKKYRAVINTSGREQVFDLPPYNFFSGQISGVQENGELKKLQILLEDSIYSTNAITYLIGVNKDSIVFASTGKGMYEVPITGNQLPSGITTFYLFNKELRKLSERSFFVSPVLANISITTDKDIYNKRSKGEVKIGVKDRLGNPSPSVITVSIVDSSVFLMRPEKTIVDEFFNGKDPIKVLSMANNISQADMDIMMLSLHNTFESIVNNSPKKLYNYENDEKALNIKGIVASKEPANKIITLISTSGRMIMSTDTSNADGQFVIPVTNYSDSTDFTVQVKSLHQKKFDEKIMIDENKFPVINGAVFQENIVVSEANKKYLHRKFAMLEEEDVNNVVSKTVARQAIDGRRVSPNSKFITGESMEKAHLTSLENAVLNLPGVQVISGYVTMSGLGGRVPGANNEPIIIFNGNEMQLGTEGGSPGISSPVLSFLQKVNPREVDFVEVLSGPEASTYGLRGGNGVIIINSNNEDRSNSNSNPLASFVADGYYRAKAFPYPDYEQKNVQQQTPRDTRTTLYFNGQVLTDNSGNLKIPFYCSDVAGSYLIVIDGITSKGNQFHKVATFQVK